MAHIIAGVALVHLFERRIQLGAILVDWSGVYTNRLWTHTFIPWEHMTTPGVSQVRPMPVMNQRPKKWASVAQNDVQLSIHKRRHAAESVRRIHDWLNRPLKVDARLQLSTWSLNQFQLFNRCFSDPDMIRFMRYSPQNQRARRVRFQHMLQTPRPCLGVGHWNIQRDGQVIGHLDWWVCNGEGNAIKVAYGIFPEARRQGAMHTVLNRFVQNALQGGVVTIIAVCFEETSPVRRS